MLGNFQPNGSKLANFPYYESADIIVKIQTKHKVDLKIYEMYFNGFTVAPVTYFSVEYSDRTMICKNVIRRKTSDL